MSTPVKVELPAVHAVTQPSAVDTSLSCACCCSSTSICQAGSLLERWLYIAPAATMPTVNAEIAEKSIISALILSCAIGRQRVSFQFLILCLNKQKQGVFQSSLMISSDLLEYTFVRRVSIPAWGSKPSQHSAGRERFSLQIHLASLT